MTGPEHYLESQRWLYKAERAGARGPDETAESCAAIAMAHAQLVTAACALANTGSWRWVEMKEGSE